MNDPHDFPALYRSADRASLAAQRRFLVALRVRLVGLLLAAVGGAITWAAGRVELGGMLALLAFLLALGAELYNAVLRPDRSWYEGRAAAESVKTLTWRYVVKGESFEDAVALQTDRTFVQELREVLQDLDDLELSTNDETESQITQKMRSLRTQDFTARRELYLNGRLRDQQGWYSRKARWNDKRRRMWLLSSIVVELAGVVVGAARAFGVLDVDLLGVLAAIAAIITAWVQAKQHETLATAYGVTAQELASVASEAEALTDEGSWARFVDEAEEAISREHTLWRASRGLRIRPVRRGAT